MHEMYVDGIRPIGTSTDHPNAISRDSGACDPAMGPSRVLDRDLLLALLAPPILSDSRIGNDCAHSGSRHRVFRIITPSQTLSLHSQIIIAINFLNYI
jgi:hypothetical protein